MKSYTNTKPQFSDSIMIIEEGIDVNHADTVNVATEQLLDNDLVLKEDISNLGKSKVDKAAFSTLDSAVYNGVDLAVKHKDEIKKYSDVWAWIKDRITKANYTGIHIGDYIPMVFKGETYEMQVAGIDTYYRIYNNPHHIDFISKDCYSAVVKWNVTNTNNGDETCSCPYYVSNLKSFLDELANDLPAEVQQVISSKRMLIEARYSSFGPLTDSTNCAWRLIGNLWVPTEYEVFGSAVKGTKGYSEGPAVQYPIFANSGKNLIKGSRPEGPRCTWWLASACGGNEGSACVVENDGCPNAYNTASEQHVPLCFRVSA